MFQNIKITTAQTFIFHMLLSLIIGGVAAGLTAAGQAALSKGFDPQIILGYGIAAFTAWFLRGFVSLESNPQFAQAILDSVAEVKTLIANAQVAQPPVVINNHLPPVTPVAPPAAAQPTVSVSQLRNTVSVPDFTAPLGVVNPGQQKPTVQ